MSMAEGARAGRANAFEHGLAPLLPVFLGVVALACLAGVIRAAAIASLHVSLDPNEGWNAYHAAAAVAGRGLYPPPGNLMFNNYPPLSFFLIGSLGTLVGDQIVAGRIVSLLSFVLVCAFAAAILRSLRTGRQPALFSALLFAGILLIASDYVGMDDPQLLGHAVQLAAAYLVLREPRTRARLCAAAVLFVAGGFVKHNLFSLPLASLLWLAVFDLRACKRLALWSVALVLAGLVVFRAGFGFELLDRLNSARSWSVSQMWSGLGYWLPLAAVPLCGLGVLVARNPRDPRVVFVAIYAGIAILAGAVLLGGAGVDVNAMFDADMAVALAAGLALDGLLGQRQPLLRAAAPLFAIACFLPSPVLAASDADWREAAFWLHPMHNEAARAARDIEFLRAHPGPAICESLAYCYWAGKPAGVDVFNLDQQLRSGKRSSAPFLLLIRSRRFAAIELDETNPFPLPQSIATAISRNYRIDHADDEGTFFVPRRSP
ncbi:MAG: glycosyltransferase family 39 protein [Rhizomicrobium sp.]